MITKFVTDEAKFNKYTSKSNPKFMSFLLLIFNITFDFLINLFFGFSKYTFFING